MEAIGEQLDDGKFLLADLDSFRVLAGVQLALNTKTGFRRGGGDQVDNDFMTHERFAAPVLGDEGEQTMLDFVPFAGPRREVADRDLQPRFVGQFL